MIWRRTAVTLAGIPVVVALVWWGPWALTFLAVLIAYVGAVEMANLSAQMGYPADGHLVGLAAVVTILLNSAGGGLDGFLLDLGLVPVFVLVVLLTSVREDKLLAAWQRITVNVYLLVYLAVPLSLLVLIRLQASGWWWALGVFLLTWSTDIAAFAAGSLLGGRHYFVPSISPHKTIAGLLAALTAGAVVLPVIVHTAVPGAASWLLAVAVFAGAALGLFAQAGDLWVSIHKRIAGVKDTGRLIPGHGGAMDRFDSFLFVIPVYYLLVLYLFSQS